MAKFQEGKAQGKSAALTHGKHYDPKIGYERNMKKPEKVLASDGAHGGGDVPHLHNESDSCKGSASPGLAERRARIAQRSPNQKLKGY